MATVSLRAYNQEIDRLIDSGRNDEAIAHCRYILQEFPKHIDTYRLLGKAYLDAKHYTDASDILQRVLSAIPDDFIANLGMSIIREDEGNLDAAIWHMERAFDMQPQNAAVQDELRRLYGRRDGVEPLKVHLTRGALSRLYVKGQLYPQAIAELRATLAEDPNRADIQMLLARSLFHSGQRVEAAEIATGVLNKLPYCLEANQLLVDILSGSERSADAATYQHRLEELDPYRGKVSPLNPTVEQVPESAVTLERYEWTPGEIAAGGVAAQAGWATSLGVNLGEPTPGEQPVPGWLENLNEPGAGEGEAEEAEAEAQPEGPEGVEFPEPAEEEALPEWLEGEPVPQEPQPLEGEQIPEWMQSTGWAVSEEEQGEPAELPGAEIPAWLDSETAPSGEAEDLEWSESGELETGAGFETIEPQESAAVISASVEMPTGVEGDLGQTIPDWLQELANEPEQAPQGEIPGATAESLGKPSEGEPQMAEEPTEPIPQGWVYENPEEAAKAEEYAPFGVESAAGAAPVDIPEWLKELSTTEAPEAQPVPGMEAEPPAEAVPPVEAEIPVITEAAPEEEVTGAIAPAGQPVSEADEAAALAWLESLAARQGAPEEELLTAPGERLEQVPEWAQETPAGAEPGMEAELGPEIAPVSAGEEELAGGGLPTLEPAAEAELEIEPAEGQVFAEGVDAIEVQPMEAEVPMEAETGEPQVEGSIPDWLRSQAPPEAVGEPAPQESEIPEWLRKVAPTEEELVEPVEAVPEELLEAEAMPDWLAGLAEPETPASAATVFAFESQEEPEEEPILGDTKPVRIHPPAPVEAVSAEVTPELAAEEIAAPEEPEAGEAPEGGEEAPIALTPEEEGAALAWLESLAARQGALEEELLIPPQERLETPPEWMAEEAEPTLYEGVPSIRKGAAFEPPGEVLTPETPPVPSAAPAVPPEIPVVPAVAEVLGPEFEAVEPEAAPLEEAVPEPMAAPPTELPEWLKAEFEAPLTAAPEAEVEAAPEAISEQEAQPELPEWLSGYAAEAAAAVPEEEEGWQPPEGAAEAFPGEAEAAPEAVAYPEPGELIDVNSASLAQLERLPGVGFILAQKIVTYRETFGPYSQLEDLGRITGVDEDTLAELGRWITVAVPEAPEAAQPSAPSGVPAGEEPVALGEARSALAGGDLPVSLQHYSGLIRAEQSLPEVIRDLEQAVVQHSQDLELIQALGDAYLRNNQLQEALEAYSRAEALIG